MKHAPPAPPELGVLDGLAYALFLPDDEPSAGVVICHGAGSAKESHFDFARGCRADGMAALAFDARGHGRSEGSFGATAFEDAVKMVDLLRTHVRHVSLRGSSMGGFCAIHAAALDGDVAAVVAICPAPEDLLLRGLRSEELHSFEMDREELEPLLESSSIYDAVAGLGPRTSLLLLHAEGDEQIPYTVSQELFEAAAEPKRLLVLPGGHHRSLQHDLELQAVSRRFIAAASRQ
jgi:uncharacterized protein